MTTCPKCKDERWVPNLQNKGRWCPVEKRWMYRPGRLQIVGIQDYEVGQDSDGGISA